MSQSNRGFGRDDIRAFFRDTLYGEEPDAPKLRSKDAVTRRRNLNEGLEDHSLSPLDQDERNRLAQAIVTGINLEFDINASGPALVELEEQVQHHLAKHPELPAILFDIAMEAVLDDDGDGMAAPGVAGSDRAEMVDTVAREVYDSMGSGSINDILDLVEDMINAGILDGTMWHSSNIDTEEIRDRVAEIEEENAGITGL